MPRARDATESRSHRREILALAIPTFATLVSEPLLLMADAAIIGHLGTTQLAGLGIAGNIIGVLAGLCIFLAYGTTATVARRLGAGDRRAALAGGIDGMVLAMLIGALLAITLQLVHAPLIGLYGASAEVAEQAATYLRISSLGFPFLLVMLAATGVLRGLQDTRTPLKVAVTLNVANILLNLALVHGLGLGIAGSAIGTVTAQLLAAGILSWVVIRGARREGTPLRFNPTGVLGAALGGAWLVLRTAALQVGITATTVVATHTGAVGLAAHQVVNSVWTFLAFALDAVAIAAQAVIGRHLGAGDADTTKRLTAMMVRWGVIGGIVCGLAIAAVSWLLPVVFTPDPDVRSLVTRVLLVVALLQPIAGVVFVLDGVLIGAGDARYLALGGLLVAIAYLPVALLVDHLGAGVVWLWAAYGVSMLGRLLVLGIRARGDRWLRLGA
ncbi:MATE family efflux transporter [Enemella dayhoffiae]|uniref:MATE family efflux transporter n=1 Tax=Enemella dayhoffiae TaxID=2016507 RepID=A0A255HCV6_9ACTN|nr:MATE family efflux transporter [Enemella dayhoffiae]OYO25206.1 MATE family efflux transporter [Enemella dayhoffiae]